MSDWIILLPVLFPILAGACMPQLHFRNRKQREWYVGIVTVLNAVFMAIVMFFVRPEGTITILNMTGKLSVSLQIDGLSCVFGSLISFLWPLAALYAFEYMAHEEEELAHKFTKEKAMQKTNNFFAFYTMTFGVTAGICFSANLMTLYLFYELLTFVTLPLVMYGMSRKVVKAGRKYVNYSVGGAAFAFIGFVFIWVFGDSLDFIYGGVLPQTLSDTQTICLQIAYVLAVFGFGVKAALFPVHAWLPTASIAPTPVTALLHAVAVVKAGAFSIIRITYYSFGADFLRGSFAQYIVMTAALITILFGSSMALKEQHLKRRLAYSTISNLSYIIFGASIMTQAGFAGSMTHLVAHGLIKIMLFYCAGAVLCKTGKEYVGELRGFAKIMPMTFVCFLIGSMALIGVPPLPGFLSKWNLAVAAAESGNAFAYVGIGVLLVSALLTAMYLFAVVFKAFFPSKNIPLSLPEEKQDAGICMKIPLFVLCIALFILGFNAVSFVSVLEKIAAGLL